METASSSSTLRTSASASSEEVPVTLFSILAKLEEAENSIVSSENSIVRPSECQRLYVRQLRRFVYDAEDAIQDECSRKPQDEVRSVVRHGSRQEDHHCLPSIIVDKYRQFAKDWEILQFIKPDHRAEPSPTPSGSIPPANTLYGMDEDFVDEIIEFLTSVIPEDCLEENGKKNLTIFPIRGGAGTGKTTFFQHIYNNARIESHFQLKSWVYTSNDDDLEVVVLRNSVLEGFNESYEGKKVLLVLDNACNRAKSFWSDFWAPFAQSAAEGSVAVITTRDRRVIDAMPSDMQRTYDLQLPALSFEDCWSLFESLIGSPRLQYQEFAEIGKEIVGKYEGIPLAVKDAAIKLRFRYDIDEWKNVSAVASCDSYWRATYREFSQPVKRCFLYCALFPSGYSFSKDHLIKLWMSEGFIEPKEGKRLEDIGVEYFDDLLYNHFLYHKLGSESDGYEMPNPVRNLAESILSPYFHRLKVGECPPGSPIEEEPRHISYIVHDEDEEIKIMFELQDLKLLRTLLVIHDRMKLVCLRLPEDTFHDMGYLRTLDLSYTNIVALPDSIGLLRTLHYLGLNGTPIEALPDSLCLLYRLQTLELNPCKNLSGLPRDIGNLIQIRHINLDPMLTSFCMPAGFSRLTNLQTFPILNVGKRQDGYGGLEELGKLENLQGDLCIHGICNASAKDSNLANLEGKKFLRYLTLCWPEKRKRSNNPGNNSSGSLIDDVNPKMEQVLHNLRPHFDLPNLVIKSYTGKQFPEWMEHSSFRNLKFIRLENCTNCDTLPSLGSLPCLGILVVVSCENVRRIERSFYWGIGSQDQNEITSRSSGFPSLVHLLFENMTNWEDWSDVSGNEFPLLNKLQLLSCPLLKGMPNIASLKTLKMENCGNVTCIPSFSSLEELEIHFCEKLINIPLMDSLKTMHMVGCSKVTCIPGFPCLEILKIENCEGLEALHPMKCLETLELENCSKLRQLPAFPCSQKLEIENSSVNFQELHSLARLKTLKLKNCSKVCQVPPLPSLQELEANNCKELLAISSMPSIEKLRLVGNEKFVLESIPECLNTFSLGSYRAPIIWDELYGTGKGNARKLESLDIFSCPKLCSMPPIPSLTSLRIENCDGLQDLPTLASLTSLTLTYCGQLKTISNQPLLRDLWVESCDQIKHEQVQAIVPSLNSLFVANCHGLLSSITLPYEHGRSYVSNEFALSFEKE